MSEPSVIYTPVLQTILVPMCPIFFVPIVQVNPVFSPKPSESVIPHQLNPAICTNASTKQKDINNAAIDEEAHPFYLFNTENVPNDIMLRQPQSPPVDTDQDDSSVLEVSIHGSDCDVIECESDDDLKIIDACDVAADIDVAFDDDPSTSAYWYKEHCKNRQNK